MSRLSPALALLLIGCDLGGVLPDTAAEDGSSSTTGGEDTVSPAAGCCSLEVSVPASVLSGAPVEVGVSLLNDDGVDLLEQAIVSLSVTGPDGALGTDGLWFQPMVAGAYTVSVEVNAAGRSFSEQSELTVEIGPAASLQVALSSDSVDPGEVVEVSLAGWDIGGNVVESLGAALSVSPEGCAEVDGLSLTALVDGTCTVTAAVGDLSEAAGFLIDGNGPLIALDSPGRGAFVSSGQVDVTGSASDAASGVASLWLNGEPVSEPGAFATSVVLSPGAHTLTVEAIDHDGNSSDLIAGVIAGEFLADGEAFGGIQLSRGADALAELGASLDFSADDLSSAVLTGTPFYDTTDGCSGMTVTATDLSVGGVSGAVTPVEGAVEVSVVVTDLAIDLEAEAWAEVRGECYSTTSTDQIVVDETEVVISVSLSAEDGAIVVEVIESGAVLSGLDEGMAAELGIDVEELLASALVSALEEAVPAAVEDALSGLSLSTSFDVMGAAVSLEASVRDVAVDSSGVTLSLESTAECAESSLEGAGSLLVSSSVASMSGDGAALSVDLLNRLLYLGWRSGGLSQHIPHEQLGLEPGIIGLLFPGAETLSLTLDPQLPPVALDAGAGDPLSLSLPELQVEAWGEVAGEEVLLGRVALHLSGTATPSIRRGALSLDLDVSDMLADSLVSEAGGVAAAESLENMLALFGGSLGADLFSDVSLPLPEELGSPTSAQTDGGGWLILSAE